MLIKGELYGRIPLASAAHLVRRYVFLFGCLEVIGLMGGFIGAISTIVSVFIRTDVTGQPGHEATRL